MHANALLGGVDHKADGHAASDGGEQLLVGAGGNVGGGEIARLVHVHLVVAHVGPGAHPVLPDHAGLPRAGYRVEDFGIPEGVQHLGQFLPGQTIQIFLLLRHVELLVADWG